MTDLPSNLEYLNDYQKAVFTQDDDDKKLFYIYLYCGEKKFKLEADRVIECNTSERERLELAIISQPEVTYHQNFRDDICIDLMHIYAGRGGVQE